MIEGFYGFLVKRFQNPQYPCDPKTGQINLPLSIDKELYHEARINRSSAFGRLTELTGAKLRFSDDYIDNLLKEPPYSKRHLDRIKRRKKKKARLKTNSE